MLAGEDILAVCLHQDVCHCKKAVLVCLVLQTFVLLDLMLVALVIVVSSFDCDLI